MWVYTLTQWHFFSNSHIRSRPIREVFASWHDQTRGTLDAPSFGGARQQRNRESETATVRFEF
jgi:hypothetical protein